MIRVIILVLWMIVVTVRLITQIIRIVRMITLLIQGYSGMRRVVAISSIGHSCVSYCIGVEASPDALAPEKEEPIIGDSSADTPKLSFLRRQSKRVKKQRKAKRMQDASETHSHNAISVVPDRAKMVSNKGSITFIVTSLVTC